MTTRSQRSHERDAPPRTKADETARYGETEGAGGRLVLPAAVCRPEPDVRREKTRFGTGRRKVEKRREYAKVAFSPKFDLFGARHGVEDGRRQYPDRVRKSGPKLTEGFPEIARQTDTTCSIILFD